MEVTLLVLLALVVLFLAIRALERQVLFHPTRSWGAITVADAGEGAREVPFESGDGTALSGLWVPAESGGDGPTILHCHGNAGNLADRLPQARLWSGEGFSVFLFDYRGYGKSGGRPHGGGLIEDARAAAGIARELGAGELVISGRSLGAVIAARVAGDLTPRALLLDSPPQSAAAMARLILPVPGIDRLLAFRFDTCAAVAGVSCPVIVQHAPDDDVVPFDHGRRVFDAAREPKLFIPLGGLGHHGPRDHPAILEAHRRFLAGNPPEA